ncbi:methyltransferase domain-containing protein [Candidatus Pacearchaeota archaeon]|nr:methyltransferase domain-containing protein [Candidatus Pacearchaeota archaeon]
MFNCRLCNTSLKKSLLKYINTPSQVQYFSDKPLKKKGVKLKIYQCPNCGLIQTSSNPPYYYKEVIRASGFSEEMINFRHKQFKEFVENYNLKDKIICEVGCGKGEYLQIVTQYAKKSFGIEFNKDSAEYCNRIGIPVVSGVFTKIPIVNTFDAFYSFSYMEHLPNIQEFLTNIKLNLNDDGVGIIEVPNFNFILKNGLFSEFMIDHLTYFTKDTLCLVMQLNGFDVLDCKEVWYDYILSVTVKKRKTLDTTIFKNKKKLLEKELSSFINTFDGDIAVWGAGHQSLFLISVFGFDKKIKYIIDSAKFKQDKYPISNIKIVSPEYAKKNPTKAILIVVGSYSNEVINIIKNQFCTNIKIAVIKNNNLEIIL